MSKNDAAMSIEGTDEMAKILEKIAPNHARNLMRSTVHGVASEITKRAKKLVPTDTGNLKKSLKTKRRRGKPSKPVSDVIAETRQRAKNDGFYWRFVEYGTRNGRKEQPFMRPARDEVFSQLDQIIAKQFTKKLASAVKRAQKRAKRV